MIRFVLALVALVALLGGLLISSNAEKGRVRTALANYASCEAALVGTDLTATAARCSEAVAAVHVQAQAAAICDQALLAGELFVVRTSCSTEVKTLFAAREAETRRADSLKETLDQERADRAAAITRAEARARSETERKIRADAIISTAPRRGDLVVLDADRLRQLGAEGAAADAP